MDLSGGALCPGGLVLAFTDLDPDLEAAADAGPLPVEAPDQIDLDIVAGGIVEVEVLLEAPPSLPLPLQLQGLGVDADKLAVTSIRAAATQFGYLLGAGAAGAALAAGGYAALGVALATLFVAAAVPHVLVVTSARARAARRADVTLGLGRA